MKVLRAKAVRGVRWSGGAAGVTALVQAAQWVVLARVLEPSDFGLMAMVLVFIGWIQTYADAGMSAALIHRQHATQEELDSLFWANVGLGLMLLGVIQVLAVSLGAAIHDMRAVPLLRLTVLATLFSSIRRQYELLLQRELRFRSLGISQVVAVLGGSSVAVCSAFLGQGVWSLAWGYLCQELVMTVSIIVQGLELYRPRFHFQRSDLRPFLGFGLYQLGERTVNYMAEKTDQFMIGWLFGAGALGYYSFAHNLVVQPITRLNPVVTRVAFPVLAKIQDDIPRLRHAYGEVLGLVALVNAPILMGLAATAPSAVPLVFGAQWAPAVVLVQIAAFVALLRSINNPLGSLLLAKGRADLGFWFNLLLFLLTPPTVWLGARADGMRGSVLAVLMLQVLLLIPCYRLLIRPLLGGCALELARAVGKPFLAAVLASGVAWWFGRMPLAAPPVVICQILAGVVCYAAVTWWTSRDRLVGLMNEGLGRGGANDRRNS